MRVVGTRGAAGDDERAGRFAAAAAPCRARDAGGSSRRGLAARGQRLGGGGAAAGVLVGHYRSLDVAALPACRADRPVPVAVVLLVTVRYRHLVGREGVGGATPALDVDVFVDGPRTRGAAAGGGIDVFSVTVARHGE